MEVKIGLEIHIELDTETKLFCSCPKVYGGAPNKYVCPVCLGYPGVLPSLNEKALEYAIKVAKIFNARINEVSLFERKNYFYPDLPKGYQITQYFIPLATDGEFENVRIERIVLEEESAKSLHKDGKVFLDFNRAGIPLVEITTYPDIKSPKQARVFLEKLRKVLIFLGVSRCDMEKGELRVDVNISVGGGERVEIKNLNSFKAVEDALNFEYARQVEIIKKGEKVLKETRMWDDIEKLTKPMRGKEIEAEYRYFPEPDLLFLKVEKDFIDNLKIPKMPWDYERFFKKEGVPAKIIESLLENFEILKIVEKLIDEIKDVKLVSNFIVSEYLRYFKEGKTLPFEDLKFILMELNKNKINLNQAKEILWNCFNKNKSVKEVYKEIISKIGEESLDSVIEEVLKSFSEEVKRYKEGKKGLLNFFLGQVMKRTKGKFPPAEVKKVLEEKLK